MRVLCALALLGLGGTQASKKSSPVLLQETQFPFDVQYSAVWVRGELGADVQGIHLLSSKRQPATSVRLLFDDLQGKKVNFAKEFAAFEKMSRVVGLQVKRVSSYRKDYGQKDHVVRGIEREYLLKRVLKTESANKTHSMRLKLWYGSDQVYLYSFQLSDTPSRYAKANRSFKKMLGTVVFK